MITLNVNSLENAEIFFKELGLEEEIALNETYDPILETLALPVEIIDEIHDKILALKLPVSPITPSVDGKHMFSFIAPEGNTFIVIGEWVEQPYTSEARTEFLTNIKALKPLSAQQLATLPAESLILFGRVTCPWTRRFARQLPAFADQTIYYVDTENTDLDLDLQAFRSTYTIATVPSFIRKNADGTFRKFDNKKENLSDFIK
ncbi:thiol-disulfide isomerase [Lactococcus kimchii]|uniref:thiol-disulfide isomerase n=1 Tax=Lactococcus sp. S-13 TaxID=2507158 RepID=UPI001022A260|nr:thiol-disulfide isomerase [Lactococcus sp. S-13]RZI49666.1 thiol-disulfide isomerase [Lactococcus sp. S-13]